MLVTDKSADKILHFDQSNSRRDGERGEATFD